MSNAINMMTKVGLMAVHIHDSDHALVRAAGDEERVQVGKFAYRVNLFFIRNSQGEWVVDPEYDSHSVYHTEGKKYWTAPAPTIKARVVEAAKDALHKVLQANPMAGVSADVKRASAAWGQAQNALDKAREACEAAQQACNEAEKAFYAAMDRETAVQLALQNAEGAK